MPDGLNGGQRRPLTPQEAELTEAMLKAQIGGQPRPVTPQEELARLLEDNKAGFAELARSGVHIDPGALLNGRINTLAEMVFGAGGPGMIEFQLRFERMVAKSIEEVRSQARKAQLAAGANISPQQVREMAKQQGLLGPDGKPLQR